MIPWEPTTRTGGMRLVVCDAYNVYEEKQLPNSIQLQMQTARKNQKHNMLNVQTELWE